MGIEQLREKFDQHLKQIIIAAFVLTFSVGFVAGRVSLNKEAMCSGGIELSADLAEGGKGSDDDNEGQGAKEGAVKECAIPVDVRGAVVNPGVYCLPSESSVLNDAVVLAGGVNLNSYAFKYVSQSINFAQPVKPGEKVYIPFQDDVVCEKKKAVENPSSTVASAQSGSGTQKDYNDTSYKNAACINLNSATKEELDTLAGVGASIAQKIIDARPFAKIEDIKNVSGIGDAMYEKIKEEICL